MVNLGALNCFDSFIKIFLKKALDCINHVIYIPALVCEKKIKVYEIPSRPTPHFTKVPQVPLNVWQVY